MKTAIVFGTRPEIIKLAPIITKLNKKNSVVIFSGQHYDYEMSIRFIEQLGLRQPDYSLKISRSDPPTQIGEIITKLPKIFKKIKPDTVIVQGDTNTVLAASLASLKSEIPVSHVEAGLRSYDWRMPEEHNRIATDHISEYLFAPTKNSKNNLISENVHGEIFLTGNTIIDSINTYSEISSRKSSLTVNVDDYILMTLHRSENVDSKKTLSSIINGILEVKHDVIFPVHPRTAKRLKEFNLYEKLSKSENVLLLDTVGYFEMLELMKNCSFIVTDSGGIQEEATAPKIRKKVLVTRKTTDRPEAVTAGMSEIVGIEKRSIIEAIKKTILNPTIPNKNTPFGKGDTSKKIIKILQKNL
ncbi:MAG TPA: UDP-N-acetylglucosamine 2-epimerase (non-hydrolyzing) [Nitrosopumilaceae archaeon]|nr:UDP-N-acetylglucosamine 2-epimerase (non-hydrolyzing) [Nitrosopumilaceae archaeon]